MAFKIELTENDVYRIKSALLRANEDLSNIIKTGKYMGKKVLKSVIETNKKTLKANEKLFEFFDGLR